ncbi:hypothetical protein [Oceanobacter mangrovi]|uniref:hypothetical protein n=1 Tax=Oceanobacter mangrovi TaxID=2862510 RepID=UPI001C8DEF6E|nr:hypothetical protein [Oceanobacter mangrovi]
MVKKTILGLTIAAATAALAGCNISSTSGNSEVNQTAIDAGSDTSEATSVSPLFNPALSQLPLNIDILYKTYPVDEDGNAVDSTDVDGTLYYAAGKDISPLTETGTVNSSYNPVYDALNDMDGFSTTAPFYIEFSGSLDTDLTAGSVWLVPLAYDGNPKTGSLVASAPFGTPAAISAEVISYADADSENTVLRISPTSPLSGSTRYLVIVLDSMLDADGNPITGSSQYQYLSDTSVESYVTSLASIKSTVEGWDTLASGFAAAAGLTADVALAYTFTTGGTTTVLNAMAAPGNANSALSNKSIPAYVQYYLGTTDDDAATKLATLQTLLTYSGSTDPATDAQALLQGYSLLSTLPAPAPRETDFSASTAVPSAYFSSSLQASFRTGRIELPYYNEAPAGAYSGESPLDGYACSEATTACAANQLTAANVVTTQWQADEDVISNIMLASGADSTTAAAYTAPSENVTDLFPFAAQQGTVSVPVMVVEPVSSCTKPATGWPVVIYQHGLTSNRMATLPLADQFAQNCMATVAIDLPLHGPMPTDTVTMDLSGLLGSGYSAVTIPQLAIVAGSENSAYSLNNFLALDDGTKTAVVTGQTISQRHFGLTSDSGTPTAVSASDASANTSGSLYINFLRFQTTRDNTRQAVMDLMNLNASIPFMDIDGDGNGTFNSAPDFDADKIYFAGISLGGIVGTDFVSVNNANTTDFNSNGNSALNPIQAAAIGVAGGGLAKLLEGSATYGPVITGTLTGSFGLTEDGASYESLLYVYQATVDSSDPVNFAAQLTATGTPYSFLKSDGDLVVPNSVDGAPLSGTNPLLAALGATQVDTTTIDSVSTPVQITYTTSDAQSSHISMAVPDTDDSTEETAYTFGVIANHIISLFTDPTAPTLDDFGLGIVETAE